ncbi:MAG TPA: sigma-70 family RNA polymerase sigma factor [Polyangia bacterium]
MSRAPTPRLTLVPAPSGGGTGAGAPAPPVARTPFDQLYAAHARYVAGLAGRVLGRDDEVADVVQEVFLIAHRRFGSLRDQTAARAWLGRIAVREASRRLRWRRFRSFLGASGPIDYDVIVDSRAAPELRPLAALLYATLDRMPTRDRLAWILRYLVDEPLETVAEICGCSLATAKRRIAAAEQRLRPLLDPETAPAVAGGREEKRR